MEPLKAPDGTRSSCAAASLGGVRLVAGTIHATDCRTLSPLKPSAANPGQGATLFIPPYPMAMNVPNGPMGPQPT
jgi:hypothetical protein